MQFKKHLFLLVLILLSTGCLKKNSKSSGTTTTGQKVETGGGSGGGSSISLDSNSLKFHYTININNARAGVAVTSPSFPSAGSPSINTSSAITTVTAVAEPADQSPTINTADQATTSSASAVVNQQDTTRTHQVLLQTAATTCTTTMSLDCAIDSGNSKQLNLTNIDTSTFTSSTTNFSLTVNGSSLSVPMVQNKITLMQSQDPSSSTNQFEFRTIGEAVALGSKIYFVGQAVISGSTYNSLYVADTTTTETRLIFNPNQSLLGGGNVKNLRVFNNELYFTSRPSTTGDFYLLKYNPTSGTISRISSASSLLNASLLTVHNNYLYFKASSTGGYDKLFKISTTGTIKQLTDICSSKSDVGQQLISTSIGLYVSLSDSTQCGNSNTYYAVSRLKNDDTVVPLSIFSPGAVDNVNDGIGTIYDVSGKTYLSVGDHYYLYRDDNTSSLVPLVRKGGWGTQAVPAKTFAANTSNIIWSANDSIFRYNISSGEVTTIYKPSGVMTGDIISFNDNAYILFNTFSSYKKLYKIASNDNMQMVADIYSSGADDYSSRYIYNNEMYFYNKNSSGYGKIFKLTIKDVVNEVSNIKNGESDCTSSCSMIGTSNGIIFSSTNFINGQYLIQ